MATSARKTSSRKEPPSGRPIMPPFYGMAKRKKGTIKWADTCRKLEKSRSYWISTTRPDGRPHAMPVWGFWMDGALIFGTGRGTVKQRNLARNPQAIVHLESGDDAVILECDVVEVDLSDQALLRTIDRASQHKYKMPLLVVPESLLFRAIPRVALAWREKDFPKSATRWVLK
ncbi:MAG: pyridoxamine 5'-phosphate oxidase family protein [Acidobacteria bacterium]|nr:pyridoxamine 5'-phosphate oxidase family protein [Acidobacteriota bacterium]